MRTTLLIAAGALAVVLLVSSPAPVAAPKSTKRVYTKADLPKLGELFSIKASLGNELRLCLMPKAHSLFTAEQTVAFGVGLFTGVATLDPYKALKAARLTARALEKAKQLKNGTDDVPCRAEMERLAKNVARHDQLCRELALDPDTVTLQRIVDIAMPLGGWTDLYRKEEADAKARCEAFNGRGNC